MQSMEFARGTLMCFALSLPLLAVTPARADAQRDAEARAGVHLAIRMPTPAVDSALPAPQRTEAEGKRCGTVCSTLVGALAGAAIGAGAMAIDVQNKPASERSIVDGPGIALGAILGAVAGGVVGLLIGLRG